MVLVCTDTSGDEHYIKIESIDRISLYMDLGSRVIFYLYCCGDRIKLEFTDKEFNQLTDNFIRSNRENKKPATSTGKNSNEF